MPKGAAIEVDGSPRHTGGYRESSLRMMTTMIAVDRTVAKRSNDLICPPSRRSRNSLTPKKQSAGLARPCPHLSLGTCRCPSSGVVSAEELPTSTMRFAGYSIAALVAFRLDSGVLSAVALRALPLSLFRALAATLALSGDMAKAKNDAILGIIRRAQCFVPFS